MPYSRQRGDLQEKKQARGHRPNRPVPYALVIHLEWTETPEKGSGYLDFSIVTWILQSSRHDMLML